LQVDDIVKSNRKYKGFMDAAKTIYKNGGVKAFFPGVTPCLIRAFIGNATCFVCYEQSKAIMNKIF
jgi:solute carrier family 25 carnitine/acylcarnitine transporter 20/29